MIQRRKMIAVFTGALCLCAVVRADMTPLCLVEAGYQPSPQVCISTDPACTSSSFAFIGFSGLAELVPPPVASAREPKSQARPTGRMKPAQILRDSQNSLSLCLYGLLGLGLCWSAPSVNRVHFGGFMDRCYRDPLRIDRSAAIVPRHLNFAPVACFIQPDFTWEDCLARRSQDATAPLLPKSQFTPTALASRGPPRRSC